jgi:putative pyruvate formate lyase activating enzyme
MESVRAATPHSFAVRAGPIAKGGAETYHFRRYISYADEAEFAPVLRVYLSGCNFRCRFCNVAPQCFDPRGGAPADAVELARECEQALAAGARYINLLGGEPSLHADMILQLAAAARVPLPLILNSNGSFSAKTRDALRGVIRVWIVDLKFGNDACAHKLAGVSDYSATVTANLRALYADQHLHVRHLLMPGHRECCFQPVVDWLDAHLGGCRFHLLTGYVPGWRAVGDAQLGRLNTRVDIARACDYLAGSRLNWSTDSHGHS